MAASALLSSRAAAQPGSEPPQAPRPTAAMVGVSFGIGSESTIMLDGRIGLLVNPHLALFGEALGIGSADGGGSLLAGGARLSGDRFFVEGRLGRMTVSHSCDFDDPCTTDTASAGVLGAGVELLQGPHAGLEVRLDMLHAFHDNLFEVGLGGAFYLF